MRGFKSVFDVCTSDRNYHLVAENDVDKRTWIETLNTTLFTSASSSPVPVPDTSQQVRAAKVNNAKCLLVRNLSVLCLFVTSAVFKILHFLLLLQCMYVFIVTIIIIHLQRSRPVGFSQSPR